jgi:hypothetical protein
MNPWVRVLLAFALAVAAAVFVKLLPPVIVLAAFVGGIVAINLRLKGRAKRERATFGSSEVVGLRLERGDPFGLAASPFALFGRCDRAEVGDVRSGLWHALEVKRFDLTCAPNDDGEGMRLACAIAPAAYAVFPLVVESTLLAERLAPPALETVEVEGLDPERWVVRCADPALAGALIDPPMVALLSELEEPWGFEVGGSLALAYGPSSAGIEEPLERLEAFARLIEQAGQRRAAQATVPERPDSAV